MTESEHLRRRPVIKSVAFSESEMEQIERRMALTGARNFGEFARKAMLDNEIVVKRLAFDPSQLRVELSRIGNNINQIARHVNVKDETTFDQMTATRNLLGEVQRLIERAEAAGE